MTQNNSNRSNEIQFAQVLKATDKEVRMMYLTGSNKFASRLMKLVK
jgi:hypothetical protein